MQLRPTSPRWALAATLVALGGIAGAARYAIGSDHQDTPFVELNPKTDLTDVYAFPGGSGRTVLAMDTRAFLTPAQATDPAEGSFDPNLLYQFKVDTDGDAGRDAATLAPMRRALVLGTRDAMLYYHAGTIELAAGDSVAARAHLRTALAVNPYWHPSQPAAVRAVLDSLER